MSDESLKAEVESARSALRSVLARLERRDEENRELRSMLEALCSLVTPTAHYIEILERRILMNGDESSEVLEQAPVQGDADGAGRVDE